MAKRYSTTKVAPSDIPSTGKYTRYNRETMDYDAFFDGQYLGSRESMDDARDLVNEHVYDLESSGMMYTATELDGDSDCEVLQGFYVSPGVNAELTGADVLNDTPCIEKVGDEITVRFGGGVAGEWNAPSIVRQVVHLTRRGLVILDTADELFVVSRAEYAQQLAVVTA